MHPLNCLLKQLHSLTNFKRLLSVPGKEGKFVGFNILEFKFPSSQDKH